MATAGWRMPLPHLTRKATTVAAPQLNRTVFRRCPEHMLTFGPGFTRGLPTQLCFAILPRAPAAL